MAKPTDLVQGTLDLLILKTIALRPMHGWGIAQRIRLVSKEVLKVQQGALYPALHRLEQQGWIRSWRHPREERHALVLQTDARPALTPSQGANRAGAQRGASVSPAKSDRR